MIDEERKKVRILETKMQGLKKTRKHESKKLRAKKQQATVNILAKGLIFGLNLGLQYQS